MIRPLKEPLHTKGTMPLMRISADRLCKFCQKDEETALHLMYRCEELID